MSVFYQCIICQHPNATVIDLHNHHIQQHNPIELSQTIINLQGFKVLNDIKCTKKKYLQPINLGDNNNNENIYNHVFIKPEPKYKYKNEAINSPKKFTHDNCSINCSQFIAWERELYQRKEITDEEFFNITESLCTDLNKKKHRGRKKKDKTGVEETNIRNMLQQINTIIGIENTTVKQVKTKPCEAATTSFWNNIDSTVNTTINEEFLVPKITNPIENTEKKQFTALEVVSTNTDTDVLTYHSSCNNYPWNSIITVSADEQEMSVDGKNLYSQPEQIDIANFL